MHTEDAQLLEILASPLRVGGVTLRSGHVLGDDAAVRARRADLGSASGVYRERAEGGVALLFSEQLTATPLSRGPSMSALAAYDERQIARFAAIAAAARPRVVSRRS